jgi:large subunit ribosomal protein L23
MPVLLLLLAAKNNYMPKKAAKTKEVADKKVQPSVLRGPRVTEKATMLAEGGKAAIYTFEIDPRANKVEVRAAIKAAYKVDPVKVNIVKLPAKMVFRRGKVGRVTGVKKALVYMKPGDKIDFA